jgi:hypothetical protein
MNQEVRIESTSPKHARFEVAARPEQATTTIEGFLSSGPSVSLGCAGNLSSCPSTRNSQQQTQQKDHIVRTSSILVSDLGGIAN